MRAVCLVEPGKPLQLQELPMPIMGEHEVLVRIRAAGICHSDAHYRAGRASMKVTPIALGHEVAGEVERVGAQVSTHKVGDRVCIHYNVTCGQCFDCIAGNEQFCTKVQMIGHHIHGGYSEYIAVPAKNAVQLPKEISFAEGATLMCASATALHALHKSRLSKGESVAVFGIGGLGVSAIQLAKALGAAKIFAVDISQEKLALAEDFGAIPINAGTQDVIPEIRKANGGRGVNVSLELVGIDQTITQSIDSLGPLGRAVMVGLANRPISLDVYKQVLANEAEIVGSNDHLLQELHMLVTMVTKKHLDTSRVVSRTIPLDADKINERLDALDRFTNDVRVVITP